jgi:signal transduction histidine kinase
MPDREASRSFDEHETFFAPAGRASLDELRDKMQRCLEQPCVGIVLQAVNGFVLILDEHRQVLAANQELLEALGRDEPCLVGLRPGEAFNCVHFTEGTDGCGTSARCRGCGAAIALLSAQQENRPATAECRLSFYKDGALHAMELGVRATPVEVGAHQVVALVLHDISAQKRRETLEQVFLHDFLDMLSGIAAWSDTLRSADPDTAATEIANLAESLKEEVLAHRTLLAAERGELVVAHQKLDAQRLLIKLEVQFARHPLAEGKRVVVRPPAAAVELHSDEALLLRVLASMVKNGLEASGAGDAVEVWFEWRDRGVTFVVQNGGVIAETVREHLFERSFSTRARAGRGLGTYSMRLFGERYLGGQVGFTSYADQGTRFFLTIPPGQPHAPSPRKAEGARRVLLVDPDERLLRLGTLFLERLGCEVTPCRNGMIALAAVEAAPDELDVVVTDWVLPGMPGEELVERIGRVRRDLPVIVCSSLGERATPPGQLPGIKAWLNRPFTLRELADSLDVAAGGEMRPS